MCKCVDDSEIKLLFVVYSMQNISPHSIPLFALPNRTIKAVVMMQIRRRSHVISVGENTSRRPESSFR